MPLGYGSFDSPWSTTNIIINCPSDNPKCDGNSVDGVFDAFYDHMGHRYPRGVLAFAIGPPAVVNAYCNWLKRKSPTELIELYNLHLFYMTRSQMDAVMKTCAALCKEYFFIELDADAHAHLITDKREHAMEGEVETTKAKIRNMPSCGIVWNATGDLVSFGLVDPSGFLNHFWTDPTHRRKGLAQAIGIELCKKCIRRGIIPYNTVLVANTAGIGSVSNNMLCTRWEREVDGRAEAVIVQYAKHYPVNRFEAKL